MDDEHYILGQHNGGVFNHYNHNVYGYCYQNPIALVDPNGKQVESSATYYSFEEYKDMYQNKNGGRCMTNPELNTYERGCIGITMINMGLTQGRPKIVGNSYHNLNNPCIAFKKALAKAKEVELETGKKVVVFTTRFWTKDDSKYIGDTNDKVDLRGFRFNEDMARGNGYTNFDFAVYDEDTNSWWGADREHDPNKIKDPKGDKMTVYNSNFSYITRPLTDFNRQIFSYAIIKNSKVNSSSARELEPLDPCIESRP
jgi:hypothetical protein